MVADHRVRAGLRALVELLGQVHRAVGLLGRRLAAPASGPRSV